MLNAVHYIILGIIQGVAEWLPISSSGLITLILVNFFNIADMDFILRQALFLHLGTFFSALVYFRKDVKHLLQSLIYFRHSGIKTKKLLRFLILSTALTGIIGVIILGILKDSLLFSSGKAITFFVGVFLLITGIVQLKVKSKGIRNISDINNSDSVFAGIAQGLSIIPGLSRSGITVSALLLKKFDDTSSLKMSFLMSLPVVLIGNIFLNISQIFFISVYSFIGLTASFVFGLLTIHSLIKLSRKINFGLFALIIALLMIISVFI